MVEVEQRRLRAFEEHVLAGAQRFVDEQRRIADIRREPLGEAGVLRPDRLEVEAVGLVDALQPEVLLGERDLDLLPQDLRVEHVLHADADARRLVGVGRPDAASRRADLQVAEPPLRRLVDRDVPRHDQVRVARDDDDRRVDAARGEVVELLEQHLRVDDAAGADHGGLARDDAARRLADLERLAAGDDRVPGVRAALVAAHDIRVLGEQVDDLALAFVTPLRPDDHGRGHPASLEAPAVGHCASAPASKGCPAPRGRRTPALELGLGDREPARDAVHRRCGGRGGRS